MPEETLKAVPALARWSAQRGPEAVQAAVAGKPASRVSIRRPGPNRVGASQMAARARTREVLRSDRGLAVEARSPPTQMSCGVEPELWRPPGRRNSAWMTKLVVYNDYVCFQCLS